MIRNIPQKQTGAFTTSWASTKGSQQGLRHTALRSANISNLIGNIKKNSMEQTVERIKGKIPTAYDLDLKELERLCELSVDIRISYYY